MARLGEADRQALREPAFFEGKADNLRSVGAPRMPFPVLEDGQDGQPAWVRWARKVFRNPRNTGRTAVLERFDAALVQTTVAVTLGPGSCWSSTSGVCGPACGFLAVRGERPVHRRARGGRHGLAAVGVGRDRFESARPAPVRRTQERRARTSSMREASATQAAVARSMNRARSGYRPGVLRAAGARCPRGGRCGCGTCAAA